MFIKKVEVKVMSFDARLDFFIELNYKKYIQDSNMQHPPTDGCVD